MFSAVPNDITRAQQLLEGYGEESSRICSAEEGTSPIGVLNQAFHAANFTAQMRRSYLIRTAAIFALCLVVAALLRNLIPLVAGCAFVGFMYLRLVGKGHARAHRFEGDYTAMLLSLASTIRTGMDPLAALLGLHKLFDSHSEVAKELKKLTEQIESGASEDDAISNFASSINHPDIRLFTTAFILARREGSSLGECLQRLARVTRQRQSFRRKVRSAVAMQKLSAFGIGGCAAVISIMQAVASRDGFAKALEHPIGSKLLALGAALLLGGIFWMVRMSNPQMEQ